MKAHERFLNYIVVDTESSYESDTTPSTEKQKNLGNMLVNEMKSLGLTDVYMSEYGYVYGTLASNYENCLAPVIGFLAHMDTSPDFSGKDVKARIVKNYDGKDIVLNAEKNIITKVSDFQKLKEYVGQDLIVTDGTTLLGADNKAGIAEILTMAEFFVNNPHIKHGTIKFGFTPDEEVGHGADNFDVKAFGADFAYTVDGGELGELSYESFNAADANIKVHGKSIHPGTAKNKMVNSILIAMELNDMLPKFDVPSHTEGREGFNHISNFEGTVELTCMKYIVRDHDMGEFNRKKEQLIRIVNYLNEKYGERTVELEIKDSYYNMGEQIAPMIHIVDSVRGIMKQMGIEPKVIPIRGGTDGSRLSYMGLPCPNICAGCENCHGKYEYVSIQSMESIVKILIGIVEFYSK